MDVKEEHLVNIYEVLATFKLFNFGKIKEVIALHP